MIWSKYVDHFSKKVRDISYDGNPSVPPVPVMEGWVHDKHMGCEG
jgi:hypothetical protein